MRWNWKVWAKILLTVIGILIGLLVDLGWKEISSGYKRNFQNSVKLDVFQSNIVLTRDTDLVQDMEREYRTLMESNVVWTPYWNSTEAIVDSKPVSGIISVAEVPLVRILVNCSCKSPQYLLRGIFSPPGMSLLHSVSLIF